jgi:hypothetical protein
LTNGGVQGYISIGKGSDESGPRCESVSVAAKRLMEKNLPISLKA